MDSLLIKRWIVSQVHVNAICKKISAGIGVLKRTKPFVPNETLHTIYKALIQPYFDYCSPLWDNCGISLKEKLRDFKTKPLGWSEEVMS